MFTTGNCLRQEVRQLNHAAPMRMIFDRNGVRFHMIVIHVGEVGVCTTTNKLLSTLADELELAVGSGVGNPCAHAATLLKKALACRPTMEDMTSAQTYMDNIRKLVASLLQCALRYLRLVLVLDGVNHMTYTPLTAFVGPKKLEAYDFAAKAERRSSASKAGSTDPFFNVPPPLFWLPHEMPVGLHLLLTMSQDSPVWTVMQERHWNRECFQMGTLAAGPAGSLTEHALARGGCDQSWGHNHGLLFRTLLDDVFIPESLECVKKLAGAPPILPASVGQQAVSGPPQPPEDLTEMMPVAGESFRAFVKRMLVDGDTMAHEQRSRHEALRNPLFIRLFVALLCMSAEPDEMLSTLFQVRCSPSPDCQQLCEHVLSTLFTRSPLAYEALCLLACAENGLQGMVGCLCCCSGRVFPRHLPLFTRIFRD